jgi:sugar phosphate isomerase/epimerase
MSSSNFDADKVCVCVSTLHPNLRQFVPADVERFTRIAADAGFPSLALQSHWVTSYGLKATRALLDEVGITAGVVEGAVNWADGPAGGVKDAEQLLDLAAAIGAGVLQGTSMATKLDSFSRAVDGFATLCERARGYNVKVSIEHIPFYAMPDLETAWRIVRESGASNGGLCIDFMHVERQRGGPNLDLLRKIPGAHISYVQLTDAPPTMADSAETYFAECMGARPVPGEGVIDIDAILDALAATGTDPYVAYQVCNPKLAGEGAAVMAARLRTNASALFA